MTRKTRSRTAFSIYISTLLFAILLSACTAGPASTIATAAAPTVAAPPQGTTSASVLFFGGFHMVDAKSGWAWQGISRLFRTDDGGTTWTEIHLAGRMLAVGGFFLSANEAWLPGPGDAQLTQAVYHTVDGGKTWTQLGRVRGPNAVLSFHDAKRGWATNGIGATGNVFYQVSQTLDGGQTWSQWQATSPGQNVESPVAGAVHTATGDSIAFSAPGTMWVAVGHDISAPYAGLSVSRDSGKTWKDINPRLPSRYVQSGAPVNAAAPQFLTDADAILPVAVGNNLVFFASHDGGNSWQSLPGAVQGNQTVPRVQFVSTNDGFAACGPDLCITHDGGQTWQKIAAPFSFDASQGGSEALQFQFVDANTGWAIVAAQGGQVDFVKTTDGGRTWTNLAPKPSF